MPRPVDKEDLVELQLEPGLQKEFDPNDLSVDDQLLAEEINFVFGPATMKFLFSKNWTVR